MTEPDPAELMEMVTQGQGADRVLFYLEDWLGNERRKVEERVFRQIEQNGFVEPHLATQAWIEYHALSTIPKRLRKVSRDGRTAAGKLEGAKIPQN